MVAIYYEIGLGAVPHSRSAVTSLSHTIQALTASTIEMGSLILAQNTEAITHIGVKVTALSSPPIYLASLQGINSSDESPDGTIKGGASPASATFDPTGWSTYTWHWIALDNSYTPSLGEMIFPVIEYSSGTISGSNYVSLAYSTSANNTSTDRGLGWGARTTNNWTSVTKSQGLMMGLRTANTRYGFPTTASSFTVTSLGTNGHRDTLKFTLPANHPDVTCYGFRCSLNPPSSADFTIGIWNAAGTALASLTIDEDHMTTTSDGWFYCEFSSPITLSAGTAYYAGVERTTVACGLFHLEMEEANDMLAYPLGTTAYKSEWNGSTWTDTTTKRPLGMDLLIKDVAASAGGGFHRRVPQIIGAGR